MAKSTGTARYVNLRRMLIASRQEAGQTQSQLGRLLDKPQSYVSKFETGERRLDIVEFMAVCRALQRDPFEFLRELYGDGKARGGR